MIDDQVINPTSTKAWKALEKDAQRIQATTIKELFASDPTRAQRFHFEGAGISLDLSKNLIDDDVMTHLLELATETKVLERRDAMFRGDPINNSENRRVLHTALRLPRSAELVLDGTDIVAEVHETLDRMGAFSDEVRDGRWLGATGKRITDVVNIGIGGSYLGPEMAALAMRRSVSAPLRAHFIANVDGADTEKITTTLDPETTLFIVASKTFTTLETMTNAQMARDWIASALGEDSVAHHFVAVSTNHEGVQAFGIAPTAMFGFWDWVGGRYSMDSAIGLSTMLLIGKDGFAEMLAGFHEVDQLFCDTPAENNLPLLLGLLRVWYGCFLGAQTIGVMPYASDLARLPAYLQQLQMESNGKRVDRSGTPLSYQSGAIYWGEPGTDGQHSFYQLLHQGTKLIPLDLIGFLTPLSSYRSSHDLLIANLIAQSQALAFGRSAEEVAASGVEEWQVPFRTFTGNKPSTLMFLDELTPRSLGSLIALYEHDVFTQGAVWGIDSFDQWGVELGKAMATSVSGALTDESVPLEYDPSTNAAIERYRASRRRWA
jgi:glucose-6-phosphate isomerase